MNYVRGDIVQTKAGAVVRLTQPMVFNAERADGERVYLLSIEELRPATEEQKAAFFASAAATNRTKKNPAKTG